MTLLHRFGIYSVIGTISLGMAVMTSADLRRLKNDRSKQIELAQRRAMPFAAAALFMALRMHRLDLRRIAILAFAVAALGDLASALLGNNATLFLPVRLLAGVGAGAAYTVAVAAFARLPDVDRGYGLFVTLQFIVSGLGLYILPVYSEALGVEGMFLSIAALAASNQSGWRSRLSNTLNASGSCGLL